MLLQVLKVVLPHYNGIADYYTSHPGMHAVRNVSHAQKAEWKLFLLCGRTAQVRKFLATEGCTSADSKAKYVYINLNVRL